ncbi:MAG: hypothetical protein NTV80_14705 [Verrucomicrobia bacterium]|nr:hypothetical protein [Verrucomicrobiota bacterium]
MKRWIIGILAVVGIAAWLGTWPAPPISASRPAASAAESERSAGSVGSDPSQVTPTAPVAAAAPYPTPEGASYRPITPRPDPPDPQAKVALEAIALNLRNYGHRFGGNPVGSNAEITASLNGQNPVKAKYLPQEHTHLSPKGELLDEWGTPYFFHQQSAHETVIRSAGPDRKLNTVDDITAK